MFGKKNKSVRIRVAGIIIQNNKVLLISHKKRKNIYWLLPGGGVDFGETLEQALKREFLEELNISIDVNELVFVNDSIEPHGKKHILNLTFFCTLLSGEFELGDDRRLYDYGFFDVDEIETVKIFPPFKDELKSILQKQTISVYGGKLWQKL